MNLGYARVSKEIQAFERALKTQVERLLQSGCDRVFADVGSRDKDDRKGLLQIIKLIESGEVRSLSVTRLDRITSSPGLFEKLSNLLRLHQVRLITLDESANIDSVDGEFAAGLQVYFSQRELKTIRLRIKKSHEHRRSKSAANSSVPFGYCVENGKYKLDHTPFICLLSDRPLSGEFKGQTYAELAQEIINTFFTVGMSASKAVKVIHQRYGVLRVKSKTKLADSSSMVFSQGDEFRYSRSRNARAGSLQWSQDGLRRWIRNPVLRGHTPYKTRLPNKGNVLPKSDWDIRYNTHPDQRLITDEQFHQIENAIALNKRIRGYGHKGEPNIFVGILVCDRCGRNMCCQAIKKDGERYYQCRGYVEERACTNRKMIRESEVKIFVVERLIAAAHEVVDYVVSPEQIIEPLEIREKRQQLEGLEALGKNPAIEAAKQEIIRQISSWEYEQKLKQTIDDSTHDLLKVFLDPHYWQKLSKQQFRQVVLSLVREARSVDGRVTTVELNL